MTRTISPTEWGSVETHRLWDWISSRSQMHDAYFTFSSGRGIIGFLRCAGLLRGKVLDYGCGPGFLTELLVEEDLETYAADYSRRSIGHIERRMAGKRGWKGATLIDGLNAPFPNDRFDLVVCIETVEHVPEENLSHLFSELARIIRPGGALLITSPNEEDLSENLNYCPFCDTEFHRWQHLRSLNVQEMRKAISSSPLVPLFVQAIDFGNFQSPVRLPAWQQLRPRILRDWVNFQVMRALDQYQPRPFPHGREFTFRLGSGIGPNLCALAIKPGDSLIHASE